MSRLMETSGHLLPARRQVSDPERRRQPSPQAEVKNPARRGAGRG